MPFDKTPQDKRSSSGDVFGTFLKTVRGASEAETDPSPEVELALLRLLKISGPQVLEKLRTMTDCASPAFIRTLYSLSEQGLVETGTDDEKFPGETVVSITQQGKDLLATKK